MSGMFALVDNKSNWVDLANLPAFIVAFPNKLLSLNPANDSSQ